MERTIKTPEYWKDKYFQPLVKAKTISGTEVTAKVVNPSTDAITEKVIVLGKAVEDADKVKKLVVKQLDPETEVLIHIKVFHKVDKLYGMTITDFMAAAGELDPATRDFIKDAIV